MIERKTVFVLSAGAHKPYGFPIGSELVMNILDLLPAARGSNTPFSELVLDQYRAIPNIYQSLLDRTISQ
jgi:hypothetical protein